MMYPTSAGHVAADGDPDTGGPFMDAIGKEMERGGNILEIFRRTVAFLEAAGVEQLPVLEYNSGGSCYLSPVRQSGTAASDVFSPPTALLQAPIPVASNNLMEGLDTATAASEKELYGTQQILEMP